MIAAMIKLLTGVQARWRGIEPFREDGTVPRRVFFANHQSHLDAIVIWAALPKEIRRTTRPVAARDYWDRTRLHRWLARRTFNAVLIDRHHVTKSNNPLIALEEATATGSLIFFPEGTRQANEDDDIGTFKSGLFHLARKDPELEIVPVYLENLNRILPKGELLFIPLLAVATVGPALRLVDGETKEAFLLRSRDALIQLRGSQRVDD